MSKINEQPTLFDVAKEKRQRKSHKRMSRNTKARMFAYYQFLSTLKMKIDNNEPYNLKALQTTFNVSKLPKRLMPQLAGVDLTLDFATEWYNNVVAPYNKAKNEKQKRDAEVVMVEVENEQPVEVVQTIEPPLSKIIADIKTLTDNFIADVEAQMAQLRELYPIY